MSLLKPAFRGLAVLVSIALAILLGAAALRVHRTLDPPRQRESELDFASMRVDARAVEFESVDGLRLSGWLLPGEPSLPPVIFCHDLGASRAGMFSLALALNDEGFPGLLFDFRGHGESEGRSSTLGLNEKRDVLGAIDYLSGLAKPANKAVGIYGVGTGAHAAVLAAGSRSSVRVLVLDGLYPDAAFRLRREFWAGWGFGTRRLDLVPSTLFAMMSGTRIGRARAAEALDGATGRDVLLLAPARDAELTGEIRRMYESIPAEPDVDGNMVVLPATQSEGLYGENRVTHQRLVVDFFVTRLPR